MTTTIINEKLLKEDIISTLIDHSDYSKKRAEEFANKYLYEIIDKMYDAETEYMEEIINRKDCL